MTSITLKLNLEAPPGVDPRVFILDALDYAKKQISAVLAGTTLEEGDLSWFPMHDDHTGLNIGECHLSIGDDDEDPEEDEQRALELQGLAAVYDQT